MKQYGLVLDFHVTFKLLNMILISKRVYLISLKWIIMNTNSQTKNNLLHEWVGVCGVPLEKYLKDNSIGANNS